MQPQLKIDNITNKPPIDTIVHFGAGRCSELDDYLNQQPRRLLLVEADPQLAEDLQNRTKDSESVQVTCAAIAGQPGPATFNRYNLPEVNSLHAANNLIELFPGLKTVEQLKVNAISPDTLLNQLNLKMAQDNLLVMDLPGEELPVLQALKQSQKLHLFSQVILHCGSQPLYEKSKPAAQILGWLQDEGFDLVAEDDSVDPDRPCWTLRRNDMQLRNRELQDQVELSAKKIQELENKAADLLDKVEALTKKINIQKKLVGKRETQIEQLKRARDEQTELAADREQQLAELRQDRDKQAKLAAERQTQIYKLIQSRDDQAKLAGERQARIEQLKMERDDKTKLAGERQSKIEKLNRVKTDFEKLAIERKQQIAELSIAQKEQEKLATKQQSKIEQLNKTIEEADKFAAERRQQIGQLTKERDEQNKLIDQLKVKIDQVAKDLERQENIVTEYQVSLDQANDGKAQSKKLVERCRIKIDELTRARDEQTQLAKNRQEHINQLVHEQDKISKLASERQSEIGQLKDKLHQAQQTADLATKLQMLRESDLKDLQQQHKEAIANQKHQNDLFNQLEERLRLAANYFHQLEDLQSILKNQ